MSTPQIGSNQLLKLTGQVDPPGEELEKIERPGIDGAMWIYVGRRAGQTQFQSSLDVSSNSAAASAILAYKLLQGTVVSVVDESGTTWSNMLVVKVEPQPLEPIMGGVGGRAGIYGKFIVNCNWTFESVNY